MTQEEKELLLKDLCNRIPYGVICNTCVGDYKLLGIDGTEAHIDCPVYDEGDGIFDILYMDVKPYLRPMNSITKKEKKEYDKLRMSFYKNAKDASLVLIDWLISHHFDYRGLIEKGLALEAPEGMYNLQLI